MSFVDIRLACIPSNSPVSRGVCPAVTFLQSSPFQFFLVLMAYVKNKIEVRLPE
jgi:hypothetical protein